MLKINNMELNNNRITVIKKLVRNSNNSTTNQNLISKWKKTIANYYKYIVLNFDGTIRDKNDRNGPINSDIIQEIYKIASYDNITVIIATGRKESGLRIVKKCFDKKEIELIMILGNGSEIISIPSIKKIYSGISFKREEIIAINNCLIEECNIPKDKIHFDKNMIRIFYNSENEASKCVSNINKKIKQNLNNCRITHSGFNIEIVPYSISKEIALSYIIDNKQKTAALTIGDAGWKYGNDFGLLSKYPSFCVGDNNLEFINYTLPVIDDKGTILSGPIATLFLLKNLIKV